MPHVRYQFFPGQTNRTRCFLFLPNYFAPSLKIFPLERARHEEHDVLGLIEGEGGFNLPNGRLQARRRIGFYLLPLTHVTKHPFDNPLPE